MQSVICWKCRRSVEPAERREKDKKTGKRWIITYCPFERCNANLDIQPTERIKIWNSKRGFFEDEA